MNLQGKELEDFLQGTADKFQSDTEFLTEHGWTKIEKKELAGEKVFSVWISPIDGKEYGHQNTLIGSNNWTSAIDRAERDLLTAEGWGDFCLGISHSELAQFRDGDERREEWAMFIHPQSKKVYTYLEAVDIARYNNDKDLDEDCLCGRTKEIQAIIDENSIEPKQDMILEVDFVLEDRKDHFYKFISVKCPE